jgi:hypothetical protein
MTGDNAPFLTPMVFLRLGWMDRYQGISHGDAISGGGAYVAEKGYGHEIFNFAKFRGRFYGYAQPPRGGHNQPGLAKIRVEKLGALPSDNAASGVLAIWVATSPEGGAYIVGWYRNATIYRDWQPPPEGSMRDHAGQSFGYYVTARVEDSVLLPPDERVFPIPQGARGAMGQSNIWYADVPEYHRDLRLEVLEYIETRKPTPANNDHADAPPHELDPFLRQRVECAAIQIVFDHYTGLGYSVNSVESDNVGWDLTAILRKRELKLEVKGLSGSEVVVQLTPNEYDIMRQHRDTHRLCVVTQALAEPKLEIFAFSVESQRWESHEGRALKAKEIIAAMVSAT